MSSSENNEKELDEKHVDLIVKFVSDIRKGKLERSEKIALATVSLLEQLIIDCKNATAVELCAVVRAAGKRICRALPHELVAANIVRRVLHAIREESRPQDDQSVEVAGESLQRLVQATTVRRGTLGGAAIDLREPIRDQIAELVAELESSSDSICTQARSHVHADELILTYGASSLAERFLRAAAPRRYRLILAEGPNVAKSHAMAARLSGAGLPVTVISSAAVCGVMSRVNKVVLGVKAALAGGALLAEAGANAATTAANYYSVPVIALAPLYKLSPLHACDQHQLTSLAAPHRTLPYQMAASGSAHVFAPQYDFVPPDHVTLFITNLGGRSPSYIYRLLSELYNPNDYQI